MKRKQIPMSFEEFETIEHPFGYKVEYWDGKAVFTPREQIVTTRLDIVRRSPDSIRDIVSLDRRFQPQIIEAFIASFEDTADFCDWPRDKIKDYAVKFVNGYFDGSRGKPHSCSVMAPAPGGDQAAGAAMFVGEDPVRLDALFVAPLFRRKKMATEMVSLALNKLYDGGIRKVCSAYHICNEASKNWHRSFGFEDVCDQQYIGAKCRWYDYEIRRREKLGLHGAMGELLKERDYWYSLVDESSIWAPLSIRARNH